MLVENGFVGDDKWNNIILVGTKADRASPEELDCWTSSRRRSQQSFLPRPLARLGLSLLQAKKFTTVTTVAPCH